MSPFGVVQAMQSAGVGVRISTIVYMSVLVMAVAVVMVDIHDGSLTAG
jgi:hypothetical protein